MQRAVLVGAALVIAVTLVIITRVVGSLSAAPIVTYGKYGSPIGALDHYDVSRNISRSIVLSSDKLPVAWSWSPDGRRLAYAILDYASGGYEIRLWTAGQPLGVPIAENLPYGSPPQWSPDSSTIAAMNANQDVCLYPVSGGATTCLNVQPALQPTWSPDGTAIAYLSRIPEGGLWRIDLTTGAASPLFTGVNRVDLPRWSPDGAYVAFTYQAAAVGPRHIYIVAGDGSGEPRQLTLGSTINDAPMWSADSRFITYSSFVEGNVRQKNVAVVAIETAETTFVTEREVVESLPRWSPDGRYFSVVFDGLNANPPQLQLQSVASLGAVTPISALDVRMYAYAWRP